MDCIIILLVSSLKYAASDQYLDELHAYNTYRQTWESCSALAYEHSL